MNTLLGDHQNEVLIEYRQFTLGRVTDVRASPVNDNSQDWTRFENEQLYFQSSGSDHYASVRIQHWGTEPTAPQDSDWEKFSEFEIFNANNALAVWTITMGPANLQLDLEPGWYNLRAYCYGREALLRTDWEYGGGDFPRSVERYILQVWDPN